MRGVQRAVARIDPDQAAHDFMTMEQRVAASPSVTNSRFFASLFSVFGTLAILLAVVGVYGVMSWVVGQHDRVRHPHGARRQRLDVVAMLLAQSLRPIAAGVALGVLGGFGLSRAFNSMFWRMTTADPIVLGGISALMLIVGLTAAWIPVHRVAGSIRSTR